MVQDFSILAGAYLQIATGTFAVLVGCAAVVLALAQLMRVAGEPETPAK